MKKILLSSVIAMLAVTAANAAVGGIASTNYVDSAVSTKVDKEYVDEELAKKADKSAIDALDSSAGGAGKYITTVTQTDGTVSAVAADIATAVAADNNNLVTSAAVATALESKADLSDLTDLESEAVKVLADKEYKVENLENTCTGNFCVLIGEKDDTGKWIATWKDVVPGI
ncbi:MAG: hypothetical protein IKW67_00420 [Alphaproteobacteria bacterium]|nr:hypothetical protein [Alphaproteobacteria bacterium]